MQKTIEDIETQREAKFYEESHESLARNQEKNKPSSLHVEDSEEQNKESDKKLSSDDDQENIRKYEESNESLARNQEKNKPFSVLGEDSDEQKNESEKKLSSDDVQENTMENKEHNITDNEEGSSNGLEQNSLEDKDQGIMNETKGESERIEGSGITKNHDLIPTMSDKSTESEISEERLLEDTKINDAASCCQKCPTSAWSRPPS